jgi:hypothetical protein
VVDEDWADADPPRETGPVRASRTRS